MPRVPESSTAVWKQEVKTGPGKVGTSQIGLGNGSGCVAMDRCHEHCKSAPDSPGKVHWLCESVGDGRRHTMRMQLSGMDAAASSPATKYPVIQPTSLGTIVACLGQAFDLGPTCLSLQLSCKELEKNWRGRATVKKMRF